MTTPLERQLADALRECDCARFGEAMTCKEDDPNHVYEWCVRCKTLDEYDNLPDASARDQQPADDKEKRP